MFPSLEGDNRVVFEDMRTDELYFTYRVGDLFSEDEFIERSAFARYMDAITMEPPSAEREFLESFEQGRQALHSWHALQYEFRTFARCGYGDYFKALASAFELFRDIPVLSPQFLFDIPVTHPVLVELPFQARI